MPISILFWVLMIIALLFGGWRGWSDAPSRPFYGFGLLLWVLLFLLGWEVFGFILQGGPTHPIR